MKFFLNLLAAGFSVFLAANASALTRYVSLNCTNPVAPYLGWDTAATNIQDAVDAAAAGDLVLVTNGVYATGGRMWFDSGTNRVTLTNAVTLESVNGPAVTLIVGNQVAGTGPVLTNAVRCVAMGNNAILSGFTLTNGEAGWGNYPNGGGVSQVGSIFAAGTVTNCVLVGNLSTNGAGGGAYRVRLINCQITSNHANSGGGACACTLINCTVESNTAASGGGVFGDSSYGPSLLNHCTLAGNSASGSGGGAYLTALTNCMLNGNSAQTGGGMYGGNANNCLMVSNRAAVSGGGASGGASGATLVNCTLVGNSAASSGGGLSGGVGAWLDNCIAYYNSAPTGPDLIGAKFNHTCTTQPLFGGGNLTNEPAFVDLVNGDFHLQSNSPCINSGNNSYVTSATDLDGNPRIAGGTVDVGAYEYQTPSSVLSYAWLQQYGLPTDGSADYANPDSDGLNNYQEWIAGTDPTNASSTLWMFSPTNGTTGLVLSWQSVSGKSYWIQRATDLSAQAPFSTIVSNLYIYSSTGTYTDTTATNGGPYFYRVAVQP